MKRPYILEKEITPRGWLIRPRRSLRDDGMKETFIDYDEENDILHINFHNHPLEADGITNTRGDFVFRSKKGAPTEVTITNFNRYADVIKLLIEHKTLKKGGNPSLYRDKPKGG